MSLFDLFSKRQGSGDLSAIRQRQDMLADARSYLTPQTPPAPALPMAQAPDPLASSGGLTAGGGMTSPVPTMAPPQTFQAPAPSLGLPTPPPSAGISPKEQQRRSNLMGMASRHFGANGAQSGFNGF